MVKKIKSHKDVKLPFGSGKTDTRPWVPRPKAQKPGQSPGDDKTDGNRHDKDWPPVAPQRPKLAKKKSVYSGKGPASA